MLSYWHLVEISALVRALGRLKLEDRGIGPGTRRARDVDRGGRFQGQVKDGHRASKLGEEWVAG